MVSCITDFVTDKKCKLFFLCQNCNFLGPTNTKRVLFGHNVDKLRQQCETSSTAAFRESEYDDIALFRTVMYCYERLQF